MNGQANHPVIRNSALGTLGTLMERPDGIPKRPFTLSVVKL